MNPFLRFLVNIAPLREQSARAFSSCVETIALSKMALLLAEGNVCNYIYFVEDGILRLFYHQEDREITDYFGFPGQLMGGIDSFFSRLPSRKTIQALTPCRLYRVSYSDLENLYQQQHNLEHIGRLLATDAFLSMQRRLYHLQFHTAQQRYEELIAANPAIVNRVPLGPYRFLFRRHPSHAEPDSIETDLTSS